MPLSWTGPGLMLWRFITNEGNARALTLIGGAIGALIAGGWAYYTYWHPKPEPAISNEVSFQPKVFAHPDVAREGRMFNIKVTVTPNTSGGGSYNIDFYWTGSGGTWSGQQTTIISFLGAQDQSLQSVSVAIDRSGCFYGGGNHQTSNGALSITPDLITHISVTLSEVHNRTQGGC